MSDVFWTALALMLVIEGLLPVLSPDTWREVFSRMLAMSNGQIRFVGLASMVVGAFALLFVWG